MKIKDLIKRLQELDPEMEAVTLGADGTHLEYYPLDVAETIEVCCRVEPHRGRYEHNPVMRSNEFTDGTPKKVFLLD